MMTHLLLLIPMSIGMGLVGLAAFFWALRNDQFEDPDGSAWRIITPQTPLRKEGTPHDDLAPHPEDRNPTRGL